MEGGVRERALIMGRGGGGLQNGKIVGPTFLRPPPSRQGKTCHAHPFSMAKTSKTTSKLLATLPLSSARFRFLLYLSVIWL